jgi:hypothetical protein
LMRDVSRILAAPGLQRDARLAARVEQVEPGFPFSILIHSRTDAKGFATRSSSLSLSPKVPSITSQRTSSVSH